MAFASRWQPSRSKWALMTPEQTHDFGCRPAGATDEVRKPPGHRYRLNWRSRVPLIEADKLFRQPASALS
jgi:hypothetical protein